MFQDIKSNVINFPGEYFRKSINKVLLDHGLTTYCNMDLEDSIDFRYAISPFYVIVYSKKLKRNFIREGLTEKYNQVFE